MTPLRFFVANMKLYGIFDNARYVPLNRLYFIQFEFKVKPANGDFRVHFEDEGDVAM